MQALNINKLTERLEECIGKTFLYHTREIRITGYKHEQDYILVQTNKDEYRVHNLSSFLGELKPVETEDESWTQVSVIVHDADKIKKLEDVLFDNIEQVKGNAEFVPQAREINSNVKTILEIEKMKLEAVKLMRGK